MSDTENNEVLDTFSPEETAQFEAMKGGKPAPEAVEKPEPVEADEPDDDEGEQDAPEVEAKDEQTEQPKKKDGRVPLRKLMAAEEKAKGLEKQLDEQRQQFARADERLRLLAEASQRANQPKPADPPDPMKDPIAAIEYERQQREQLQAQYQQQQRATQEQAQIAQIDNGYRRSWSQFAQNTPDAGDAYSHWTGALSEYFESVGVPADQVEALVISEERRIALAAAQQGKNPAEVVYNLSKRFGYAPKPAQADDAGKRADAEIERRQKAAPAAKSLTNTGGSRNNGIPSASELAAMSDDDFADLANRLSPRELNRILGAA